MDTERKPQPKAILESNQPEPRTVETTYGPLAYAIHRGVGRERQEDRLGVLDEEVNGRRHAGFVVVDGIGGEAHGDVAAQILAEEMLSALRTGQFADAQQRAHDRMHEQASSGGACYAAILLGSRAGQALSAHAGDVRTVILDNNKTPDTSTRDDDFSESEDITLRTLASQYPNIVTNSVRSESPGQARIRTFPLELGDWILCATDGLWDNLGRSAQEQTEKAAELIADTSTPAEAVKMLLDYTLAEMYSGGKKDNLSIIVLQVTKLP